MRVFTTLLLDSLQLLRARVLFWITLWISAFAAILYLSVGFTSDGVSLLFGLFSFKIDALKEGSQLAEMVYLKIFSEILVGWWLSWIAVILALISCAPIFPDFMSEGSIGISLSKPVSRLTLFLYKYVGSLLFVFLQVTIFCVIVFFAIRLRVGTWNPTIFWAVPVVTLMFSYIYSVVVLVSVRTRSVLAAILAGIVVWFTAAGSQRSEDYFYIRSQPKLSTVVPGFGGEPSPPEEMKKWYDLNRAAMLPLPKTAETIRLLDRLITLKGTHGEADKSLIGASAGAEDEMGQELQGAAVRHSPLYVLGTSLLFEAVMLGFAAWIFCRRDY